MACVPQPAQANVRRIPDGPESEEPDGKTRLRNMNAMETKIAINDTACIRCGRCVRVCPSRIFTDRADDRPGIVNPGMCIVCGHCAAACPTAAVEHAGFPADKIHRIDRSAMPAPAQVLELCRARRSNRAFTADPIPPESLRMILEAAHRAPTASNLQQVAFTVVTDPARLREMSGFTVDVFSRVMRLLRNPLLRPVLSRMMPDAYRMIPAFERIQRLWASGDDLILRGATAVILIHTPAASRFGVEDSNLAYQNASLMAQSLGVSQFYTGFVLSAVRQDRKGTLERRLGIDGVIRAGIALGMPEFSYPNYVDRRELIVRYL